MAIPDAGKLFESTSTNYQVIHSVSFGIKAGSLIVLFIGGESTGTLDVAAVTDTKGNVWRLARNPGSTMVAIAWTRTKVAMTTADKIQVTLNKNAGACWRSCHVFEGASADALDTQTSNATTTQAYVTVDVAGSDWLAVGMSYFPSSAQMTTTEVDSSLSQDDSGSAAPYAECWSCNGSGGSSTRIGATIATAKYRRAVGVSFGSDPLGSARQNPNFMIGV